MAKKKRKKAKDIKKSKTVLFLDYYTTAFALLHSKLSEYGYDEKPHDIRSTFWQNVIPAYYDSDSGAQLLKTYLKVVESKIKSKIKKQSIIYWMHLYRRIYPGAIFANDSPLTTLNVRGAFEAAIQKYGKLEGCDRVSFSDNVTIEKILDGLLLADEFKREKDLVQSTKQLVLTKFGIKELLELYSIEKLNYEIWRAMAHLRSLSKGASLFVENDHFQIGSDELQHLIINYDKRLKHSNHGSYCSSSGIVFDKDDSKTKDSGNIFLPNYNVMDITTKDVSKLIKQVLKSKLAYEISTNFIWTSFNVRAYYNAHKAFSTAFYKINKVSLESVLSIIASLAFRVMTFWFSGAGEYFFNFWQRGYEGPHTKKYIEKELKKCLPEGKRILGINENINIDVERAFEFWKLTPEKRKDINICYPITQSVFLPYGSDKFIIDYAWVLDRLFNLFIGVKMSDQNFKGIALEEFVRKEEIYLPHAEIKAVNGEKRQIDASFKFADILVIVECRSFWRSVGFEIGDQKAIKYRSEKIDKAISDIDKKAQWLIKNPVGHNYDISSMKKIIPVVVTPFVEYIFSSNKKYWLDEYNPRIIAPLEFKKLMEDNYFDKVKFNVFYK